MIVRRQIILDEIARRGTCSYQELAQITGVSTMTIRRDVDALARESRAIKTLRGVQGTGVASWYETDIRSRLNVNLREKTAIAARALEMVTEQQTLFLDGSTTCIQLAKKIAAHRRDLTIVTNSVFVCLELGGTGNNRVLSLGGELDPHSASFVGVASEESAGQFFVDLAFMSTKGFHPTDGTFESSLSTIQIKRIIAQQCDRTILLVDHSKFHQRALSKVLDISQIYEVITDDQTSEDDISTLREKGMVVHVATIPTSVGESE
jgi:DeoR family transcriptional regulator, fructose operon transcriptional repressor